jgi:hypothetical protein
MLRSYRPIGLAIIAVLVAHLFMVLPAYACSVGPDFDPVAEADSIVGGRITAWERLPTEAGTPFTPIRVSLAVDQQFKGAIGNTIQFTDRASLLSSASAETWAGSSGACGAFDSDPTGQYMVLGLETTPQGDYVASLMLVFFLGPEPAGERYDQALDWLAPLSPTAPPTLAPTLQPTPQPPPATLAPVPTATPTIQPAVDPVTQQNGLPLTFWLALVLGGAVIVGGLAVLVRRW